MTDRELLELAAKAAGIDGRYEDGYIAYFESSGVPPEDSAWTELWNPLTDDGDALRLAVKLRLNIEPNYSWEVQGDMTTSIPHESVTCGFKWEDDWCEETCNDDPYAATRRAIVRAAAEIGRTM